MEPEETEAPFDPVDYTLAQRRLSLSNAFASIDDDPEKAARAQELGERTGTPPALVYGDLDNFEKQHKAGLAAEILNNSAALRKYLDDEPLAAKVSNDDYGQLDTVAQTLGKRGMDSILGAAIKASAKVAGYYGAVTGATAKGFVETADYEMWNKEINDLSTRLANYPVMQNLFVREGVVAGASAFVGTLATLTGAVSGVAAGVGESAKQFGMPEAEANRLVRDLIIAANTSMPELARIPEVTAAANAYKALKPYIDAGVEPPLGVHPIADQMKAEQAKVDVDNLNEALKEATKSTTRERSPELFTKFIRSITDGEIGVSADAVRKLYGDKVPLPDDGLLGFVPDLEAQLRRAETTGGDITVNLAEWLGKVEPEVAKGLQDHIRARPEGLTVEEAKLPATPVEYDVVGLPKKDFISQISKGDSTVPTVEELNSLMSSIDQADKGNLGLDDKTFKRLQQLNREIDQGSDTAIAEKNKILESIPEETPDLNLPDVDALRQLSTEYKNLERDAFETPAVHEDGMVRTLKRYVAGFMEGEDFSRAVFRKAFDEARKHGIDTKALGNKVIDRYLSDLSLSDQAFMREEFAKLTRPKLGVSVIETTRQSAALQSVQERKLTLQKEGEGRNQIIAGKVTGDISHSFNLVDAEGKSRGVLDIAEENGGKRLYVDDIRGLEGGENANAFGPRAMREVLEQIREQFPNAETLAGYRASGARWKDPEASGVGKGKDNIGNVEIDLTKIKPRAKAPEPEKPGLVQRAKDAVLGKSEEAKAAEAAAAEERALFDKAASIGMTVDQYKRYQKLIEKQQAEDVAYYTKRAEAEAQKKLSKEWKETETELRPQVADEINSRPDIAADNYLRSGTLFGEQAKAVKLGEEYLSAEQRKALPAEFVAKEGAHPDDVASLVGYASGNELVAGLAKLQQDRAASGMNATNYRRRLIGAELERQVAARMSKRADEVLAEAKDHVLSETQQQLLHEQTLRLAEEAGAELPITKEDLAVGIKEVMDNSRLMDKAISSDAFLADAGRAGRAMEMAHLKGDVAEAFRQSQRQTHAFAFAREALKLEAEKAKFDKLAKKYSGREVKRVDPAATNYIQMLLSNAGVKLRLTPEEIATGIAHEGYASFPDYIVDKQQMGWEPQVADFVAAGGKPLDKMTVAEFREFKEAIDSLDFIGRKEAQVDLLGEKMDWAEFQSKVIANLETLPMRSREGQGRWFYKLDASLARMEELAKDFDLRQELGPVYTAVIEPMMLSKAKAFDLMTDLSKHFKQTRGDFGRKWRKSLEDTIPQDFMIDSYTRAPLDMTRENLINVMLNWGNRSNIEKVTRGYASLELGRIATKEEAAAFEVRLKQLIDTHARKEDWDFVTRMWEPFKNWQPMIDTLSRNVSGSAPKWIEAVPVETPHGKIEGGYWPVKYDRLGSDLNVVEDRKANVDGLFGPNYIRATTAKGHLKERTGYVDFVDLHNSIEQAAGVMQQTIQDIAFRDSLIQASKVFYDKPIRAAIRKHYGAEYEAQLIPWLKRIANQYTADDKAVSGVFDLMRRARINLVGHALPLNLKVILSPDIGVPNPKAWASFEANRAENVKFAMEHSNEIRHLVYNMDRDFREQLTRSMKEGTFSSVQGKAVEWGFIPVMKVSQEFRMSTFVDQYAKAKAAGHSDHEATVIADSHVRERHGAASVVDLPAIMQSNEAMKALTMFYGYFNTMYNWQRQLPGNIRRGEAKNFMVNGLGSVVVGAAFGAALFNEGKESDSWWKTVGKAMLLQPLSTVPGLREAGSSLIEGRPSGTPIASLINAVGAAGTEAKRFARNEPMKHPIRTGANLTGALTGLPMTQIGRSSQFIADVQARKQRPRNILEYMRGFIHGEARLKP